MNLSRQRTVDAEVGSPQRCPVNDETTAWALDWDTVASGSLSDDSLLSLRSTHSNPTNNLNNTHNSTNKDSAQTIAQPSTTPLVEVATSCPIPESTPASLPSPPPAPPRAIRFQEDNDATQTTENGEVEKDYRRPSRSPQLKASDEKFVGSTPRTVPGDFSHLWLNSSCLPTSGSEDTFLQLSTNSARSSARNSKVLSRPLTGSPALGPTHTLIMEETRSPSDRSLTPTHHQKDPKKSIATLGPTPGSLFPTSRSDSLLIHALSPHSLPLSPKASTPLSTRSHGRPLEPHTLSSSASPTTPGHFRGLASLVAEVDC